MYHMKILVGDFNAKVVRKDIFKSKFGKESVYRDRNDNDVRTEILPLRKIYLLRARCS